MSTKSASGRFLLAYASQTGQAQAISEEIAEQAVERGLRVDLHCLSESEKKFKLEEEDIVVIVTSTTGDGEPPDTATKFWRKLKRKTVPRDHLHRCNYALLGLGDSNYTNFCNMGKMLNKRMLELGATQFYEPGYADDGVGLDLVVEPWIDGLWEPLEALLRGHKPASPHSQTSPSTDVTMTTPNSLTIECERTSAAAISQSTTVSEKSTKTNGPTQKKALPLTKSASDVVVKSEKAAMARSRSSSSGVTVSTPQKTPSGQSQSGRVRKTSETKSGSVNGMVTSRSHGNQPAKVGSESRTSAQKAASLPRNGRQRSAPDLQGSKDVQSLAPQLVGLQISRSVVKTVGFAELERDLRAPTAELRGVQLSLPSVPTPHIAVRLTLSPGRALPFPYKQVHYGAKSTVTMATITEKRFLTREGSAKRTLEVEMKAETLSYEPGFAFGFVCPNPQGEVDYLLSRLKMERQSSSLMHLSIVPGTTKKNAVIPKHIPVPCSVRHFFTHCADIRCVPKKALLSMLSSCCSSDSDKKRLQELASKQGAAVYTRLFTELHTDFLDVLHTFPSCQPSLQRLVESLPRLQPRFYSAACSPLTNTGHVRIAFNVLELPERAWLGGRRQGLSSGWFDREGERGMQVPLVPRGLNRFRLPADPSLPIIMIGPGTGVSPFIGFLQHRRHQRREKKVGRSWLFFGCRHPDQDYLYREELEGFVADGTLSQLDVSLSRLDQSADGARGRSLEGRPTRYVQEAIRAQWSELGRLVMEESAVVYVCGDAVSMSKDIQHVWVQVLEEYLQKKGGSCACPAESVLTQLKENGKYMVDVWT